MSLVGKILGDPASSAPKVDPEPPVTRAEFSRLDESIRTMTESIRELAQRPVVVQAPAAPIATAPDLTDEEINEAISLGQGAKTMRTLLNQKVSAAKAEVAAEVAQIREYGTTMLGTLADRAFISSLDADDRRVFSRYEKEIRATVNMCEPALRGHPDTWLTAYNAVVGQHRKELEAEAIEAENRRHADAATAAIQPGNRGSQRGSAPDNEDDIPTLHEMAGEFADRLGEMSEDDFIKRMNRGKRGAQRYKDMADYVKRGRDIDAQLAAIYNGEADNGDDPIPRSLQ